MDSVFLYVNSTFAPALDEIVGNLHRVSYSGIFFGGCQERADTLRKMLGVVVLMLDCGSLVF